jgi:NADH dehydrogenase
MPHLDSRRWCWNGLVFKHITFDLLTQLSESCIAMETRPLSVMLPLRRQALRIRNPLPSVAHRLHSTYTSTTSIIPTLHTPGRRCLATQAQQPTAAQESDDKRERVVILGSGWGGYTLSRRLSPKTFASLIISPRSYFVFTPLLTNTASGSLDFSNRARSALQSQLHPRSCAWS